MGVDAMKRPLMLIAFTNAAFKAQPLEATGLAPRGLAATLCEDKEARKQLHADNLQIDLIDFIKRRQKRVVRSTFNAEFASIVVNVEHILLLQRTLHQTYCGAAQSTERMIHPLETGLLYPQLDICVYAEAEYDVIAAPDVCEFAECSLKLHLIPVRDRMTHGLIRKFHWIDTRDILAHGLTKGGIDWSPPHKVFNDCVYECKQFATIRNKIGLPSSSPPHDSAER